MQYRPEIDGLRALAIVPVVLFHAGMPGLSGGFVGVDVFFVISGFLITAIIAREVGEGTFSIVRFYERRARRILPALTVMVLATLAVGFLIQPPPRYADTAEAAVATALFASNFYFWQQLDYFAVASEFKPLLHTWSLAVEEQFYLFWPLVLLCLAPRSAAARHVAIAAILVGSLALCVWASGRYPASSFYLLPTRAWEMMIGALLALGVVPAVSHRLVREAGAAAGLALIVTAMVLFSERTVFPGIAAIVPCLGAALIIHCAKGTMVGALLSLRPVVFVGLISYSLYLWHWPPLAFASIVNGSTALPPATAAAAVALAGALAVLSWRYVERPFRDRRTIGRVPAFTLAGTSLASVSAVGLAIWLAGGMPARFEPHALMRYHEALTPGDGRARCRERHPLDGLCRIGAPDKTPTILLWGDSHAEAAFPALDLALQSVDKAGLAAFHGACPPIPHVRRTANWQGCADFLDAIVAMIEAPSAPIETVVMVARWTLSVTGERSEGEGGDAVHLVSRASARDPHTPSSNAELVREGLEDIIARLRARGVSVVLVGDVPTFGWHVPDQLLIRDKLSLPDLQAPTIETIKTRHRQSDAILATLAQREGVTFVPVAGLFCQPECEAARAGRALYQDDDHLSHYGAAAVLGPYLRAAIWPEHDFAGPSERLVRPHKTLWYPNAIIAAEQRPRPDALHVHRVSERAPQGQFLSR